MNNQMITSLIISVLYLITKFIEMRFILKENNPLKGLARDTLVVYLSVILGNFVMSQVGGIDISKSVPQVFTNNPDF